MDKKERALFGAKTIKKFLSGRDYEDFVKNYEANVSNFRKAVPVNETDFAILEAYMGGMTNPRHIAEKFNLSTTAVLTSVRKAALARLSK